MEDLAPRDDEAAVSMFVGALGRRAQPHVFHHAHGTIGSIGVRICLGSFQYRTWIAVVPSQLGQRAVKII